MKKVIKITLYTCIVLTIGWCILTLVVEKTGPSKSWDFGHGDAAEKVLIVYDPDPFYNFDEQVCLSFAEALADSGINVKVASVAAAKELEFGSFNAFVFCANTYNWRPDWAITSYIHEQRSLNNKPVIAITVGAGSTEASKEKFEQQITRHEGKLIDSRSLWLMRPNDEARTQESNEQVALSITRTWAKSMAHEIRNTD